MVPRHPYRVSQRLCAAWSFKAFSGPGVELDTYYELVALKDIAGKGAVLDGSVITSARVNYNQMTAAAEVR